MAAVQFWGMDQVLNAYEHRDCAAWSIWQGKQFLFKGEYSELSEGQTALIEVLKMISPQSSAIYTLRVYEKIEGGKIKSTTPDDGSFNFKLLPEGNTSIAGTYPYPGTPAVYNQEIAELKKQVAELKEELAQDPEPYEPEPDFIERINGILEKPAIVGLINKIFNTNITPKPATVGFIPTDAREATLNDTIENLKKHDEKLLEHLGKLSQMAINNPTNFNYLLTVLDGLQ